MESTKVFRAKALALAIAVGLGSLSTVVAADTLEELKAQIDALVAVYHADHRELCAHERDYPFRIMNILEIVGESMGLRHEDQFKRLKMMQEAA